MKKKHRLRSLAALSLSAFLAVPQCIQAFAQDQTTVLSAKEIDEGDSSRIVLYSSTLLNARQEPEVIGEAQKVDMDSLEQTLQSGQMTSVKGGVYTNTENAMYGIVQLTFTVAAKEEQQQEPINVLLVLDQSGSMNMYCTYETPYTMVCLNDEHYYYIPAGLFGNHAGGYVNVNEFNPDGPTWSEMYGTNEQGESWVAKWAVDMLNSLGPLTDSEVSAQDLQTILDQNDPLQQAGDDNKEPEASLEDVTETKASSSLQEAAADAQTADVDLNTESSAAQNTLQPADSVQQTQVSASVLADTGLDLQDNVTGSVQAETQVQEESEQEMVLVTPEPYYETVYEEVQVQDPDVLTEITKTVTVEGASYWDETSQEWVKLPDSQEEQTVQEWVTPEPRTEIVEKQVLVTPEPYYELQTVHSEDSQSASSETAAAPADSSEPSLPAETASAVTETQIPEQTLQDDPDSQASFVQPAQEEASQSMEEGQTEPAMTENLEPVLETEGSAVQASKTSQPALSESDTAVFAAQEESALLEEESALLTIGDRVVNVTPVYNSGYDVTADKVQNVWNPSTQHYYKDGDTYVHIDVPAYEEMTIDGYAMEDYPYYSASMDNAYGCYDRSLTSKKYAQEFVKDILANNPENKVAVMEFSTTVPQGAMTEFTSDYDNLASILNYTNGGRHTNYQLAFETAAQMLETDPGYMEGKATYVVLISDGMPDSCLMKDASQADIEKYGSIMNYAGYVAASQLKEEYPDLTLYTLGLQTAEAEYLSELSSTPQDSANFLNLEDLKAFLSGMASSWQKEWPENGVVKDVIADGFTFLIGEDYPFVYEGQACTSLEQLPEAIVVDGQNVTVALPDLSAGSVSFSFYVKADPSLMDSTEKWTLAPTNSSAALSYSPAVIENGKLTYGSTQTVSMPSPVAKFGSSVITVTKSSDSLGKTLEKGDIVEYSLTVKNTGLVDAEKMYISDAVPEGCEYVLGGTLESGQVVFEVNSLAAGESRTYSFKVKVLLDKEGTIENTGAFGLDGTPSLPTNTIVNPVKAVPAVSAGTKEEARQKETVMAGTTAGSYAPAASVSTAAKTDTGWHTAMLLAGAAGVVLLWSLQQKRRVR